MINEGEFIAIENVKGQKIHIHRNKANATSETYACDIYNKRLLGVKSKNMNA